MKNKKLVSMILILTMLLTLTLTACGEKDSEDPTGSETTDSKTEETSQTESKENVNKSGMPIVDEPITLTMFTGKSAQNVNSDWNDILIWNEYEDMTNIKLEWKDQVQTDSLEEKRNLALAGGTLPDVFYLASMPTTDLYKYGQQGVFVKLNDLIDEYAPNLKKLMEKDPSIKKAITFPDGNIYSLPSVVSEDFTSVRIASRPWFKWLDEVGMDVPETTDEFYEYLKAVKEKDPRGDGTSIPYGGTSMGELVSWLAGSFGIQNKGVRNGSIDLDPEDENKIRFYPITDEYKELLEYVHKLYSEELIEQNIFSIEWGQYLANASEGVYGSTIFYDPVELFGEEIGKEYESGSALKGPNGHQMFTKVSPTVVSIGNFVITKENPNPAAAVRWMDYFYSDEGATLYYMGIEGETYEVTDDGEYVYTDKILNSPEGLTFEQELAKYLTWLGGPMGIIKEEYFQGSEAAPASLEAAKKIEPYIPDEIWPAFTYTEEENKFLSSTGTDISKYVAEMQDKFISGDVPFSKWDDYVKTLESMQLEKYMEIQQAAYERYKNE